MLESDWIRTELVTHREKERESYGADARGGGWGGGSRTRNASGNARTSGVPRLCRWMPKKSAEGGGGFFPIKQPAEFVFSPKRRCRFKVIDCHREGGTDVG